jgi:hypothetical protein
MPESTLYNTYYLNHYECDRCRCTWEDEWDCMCDDRCPVCNWSVSPHQSDMIDGGTYCP